MRKGTKKNVKIKQSHFEKLFNEGKFYWLKDELNKYLIENPDDIDCLLKIAAVYRQLQNYSFAESSYIKVIQLKPNNPYVYSVYGELLFHVGLMDRAIKQYDKALNIDKNYFYSLYGKGQALSKKLDYEEAIRCFKLALKSQPESENILRSIGACYKRLGLYKEASEVYKSITQKKYKHRIDHFNNYLESLYLLGDEHLFYDALNNIISEKILSSKTASISSHASIRFNRKDKYPLCSQPLDYIYKKNLIEDGKLNKNDMRKIIDISKIDTAVLRRQELLEGGRQTSGNIFDNDSSITQHFLDIITNELQKYKLAFPDECELISSFPENYKIRGWLIEIENAGFLKPHIHERGWISGSIYLSLPLNRQGDEGNIRFSTDGMDYPKDDKSFPMKVVDLGLGDIVLFPSSLFHSTIPFNSNHRRITLAFDVIPS
tara:strand:+ start:21205 stop:22500 length:1296 start_codon:yes stop_codon:yes gene_type:complete